MEVLEHIATRSSVYDVDIDIRMKQVSGSCVIRLVARLVAHAMSGLVQSAIHETTHYSWKIDRHLIRVIRELGTSRLDLVSFNNIFMCKGLEDWMYSWIASSVER